METVALSVTGENEMNDLLIKLLELFCQIGVKIRDINEKSFKNILKVCFFLPWPIRRSINYGHYVSLSVCVRLKF